jgi:hypothetical protein
MKHPPYTHTILPPPPCPHGCDHTDDEHRAFDRGVRDGRAGVDENPYLNSYSYRLSLVEAWATGHSVGMLDAEQEVTPC